MAHNVRRKDRREVTREVFHRGAKFDFERVTFENARGEQISREVVRHPGAVVILPLLQRAGGEPQVVLIRNFRTALGKEIWELPAGTREAGEEAIKTAGRELIEETGYESATMVELGRFYTSPGLSDELMYAFVAQGLTEVGQHLEADEDISVHPTALSMAFAMIERGEILDAKSILTLLWAQEKGLLNVGHSR